MKLKTAGRATAAVAAFGTALGPVAASLPASASAARPAATGAAAKVVRPVKADAAARPTQTGLCGGNLNFQLVSSSQVLNTDTGSPSGDLIQLYYNPTTRCVYTKFLNSSSQCGETINGGKVNCFAVLVANSSSGTDVIPGCGPVAANQSCISPFFYDGGIQTAGLADRTWGLAHWQGKTRFF